MKQRPERKPPSEAATFAVIAAGAAMIFGLMLLWNREQRVRTSQEQVIKAELVRQAEARRNSPAQRALDGRLSPREERDLVEAAREQDRRRRGAETPTEARDRRDAAEDLRRAHEQRERERLAAKERELAAERDAWRAEATAFVRRALAGQDVGPLAAARDRLGTIAEHIYTTPELAADAREALKALEAR